MSVKEIPLEDLLRESVAEDIPWVDSIQDVRKLVIANLPTEPSSIATAEKASVAATPQPIERQHSLFGSMVPENTPQPAVKQIRYKDLIDTVIAAYKQVYSGYSVDRLIADTTKNVEFIKACWKLDAMASQTELNHTLLHARKNNHLGRVPGVERYTVSRKKMDLYAFSSELAVKALQEEEFSTKQRSITIDDILCDPDLGKRFLSIASSISPGHNPVDYRWAALSVRKASNRSTALTPSIGDFNMLGRLDAITSNNIDDTRGLFWIAGQYCDVYVGHAESLRTHITSLLDSPKHSVACISEQLRADNLFQCQLGVLPTPISATKREPMKSSIVKAIEPKFNVLFHIDKVA